MYVVHPLLLFVLYHSRCSVYLVYLVWFLFTLGDEWRNDRPSRLIALSPWSRHSELPWLSETSPLTVRICALFPSLVPPQHLHPPFSFRIVALTTLQNIFQLYYHLSTGISDLRITSYRAELGRDGFSRFNARSWNEFGMTPSYSREGVAKPGLRFVGFRPSFSWYLVAFGRMTGLCVWWCAGGDGPGDGDHAYDAVDYGPVGTTNQAATNSKIY